MAKSSTKAPQSRADLVPQLPCGTIRTCIPYRGELARHRLITADGHDYVVATTSSDEHGRSFVTGAYPVSRGYLVMIRQPLREIRSEDRETARRQHEQLVRVLAEAGVGVVRAQRTLAARRHAEHAEAARQEQGAGVFLVSLHRGDAIAAMNAN